LRCLLPLMFFLLHLSSWAAVANVGRRRRTRNP
jgi:hypothetical protein